MGDLRLLWLNDRHLYDMASSWADDCRRDGISYDVAKEYLSKWIKEYSDILYERVLDRLGGDPLLTEFVMYPSTDFDRIAEGFLDDYVDDAVEDANAADPGDRITEDAYDHFRNVLPPKEAPASLLNRYGCVEGYLMGEPWDVDSDGRDLYRAYGRTKDGTCLYLGPSPEAGRSSGSKRSKAPARKPTSKTASKPKTASKSAKSRTATAKRKTSAKRTKGVR